MGRLLVRITALFEKWHLHLHFALEVVLVVERCDTQNLFHYCSQVIYLISILDL